MNWKRCVRKRSWLNLRYSPGICLEELRAKTGTGQAYFCNMAVIKQVNVRRLEFH
jgi:hypothetical protein